MKKLGVILGSLLFLMACANQNSDLEDAIFSVVKDKNQHEVDVSSLVDFDWDKAYLITPYTPQETINSQLGVEFKDPSDMHRRDDIYLMVFLHEDKVVQYAEIDRQQADFSFGVKEYLTPDDGVLLINRN